MMETTGYRRNDLNPNGCAGTNTIMNTSTNTNANTNAGNNSNAIYCELYTYVHNIKNTYETYIVMPRNGCYLLCMLVVLSDFELQLGSFHVEEVIPIRRT